MNFSSKPSRVSLSASTVSRRNDETAEDAEAQLLGRVRESPWHAIQAAESTEVDDKATRLVSE